MNGDNELIETPNRIEPALLTEIDLNIADLIAEISALGSELGRTLNPMTAASLADLVRIMNAYYSNLIEGHNTRPREIEKALKGQFDDEQDKSDLQMEAAAHVRVQKKIDELALQDNLPEPTSIEFICWLHEEFYKDAPERLLLIKGTKREFIMRPGEFRSTAEHDVIVGLHQPPSSERVRDFMQHFENRYKSDGMRMGARIMAIAAAHHRLNYIHPFADGNGRVSRLMSHAMAHKAGIGAHGLWSVSRGLARGINSRSEYKSMMNHADTQRQNDYDGCGNLSQRALTEFTTWFLRVCLDQLKFMSMLFDLKNLDQRLKTYVETKGNLKSETTLLLQEILIRGDLERGAVPRVTGLPERSARRLLNDILSTGLLDSNTPKGPVFLKFPASDLEILFPLLYPQS